MGPIMREIFLEPVGWLAIGGSIIMVASGLYVAFYVNKKVREEEKQNQQK